MDISILKAIYLFSEFSEQELKKVLEICTEKNSMPGQEVFSIGQRAESLFVVTMGSIQISVNSQEGDELKIRHFGSGSHFGEMAFLDNSPRSATATATENSHLLEIRYERLGQILEAEPGMAIKFYRSTAKFLTTRLRATTSDLNQLREQRFHN
jgi:CRP-like cAMP-binding protein